MASPLLLRPLVAHHLRAGLLACFVSMLGCAPGEGAPADARSDASDITPSANCDAGCPTGFTCERGACVGGDRTALALDWATVPVSGVVTVNGTKLTLGTVDFASDVFIRVALTDLDTGVVTLLDDWRLGMEVGAFSGTARPGTYRVTAQRNYVDGAPELPSGQVLLASIVDDHRRGPAISH